MGPDRGDGAPGIRSGVLSRPARESTQPDPDGLLPDELAALPGPLVASPHCVGLDATVYDPDLDPDGTAGALLTDIVVRTFAEPAPPH